MDQESKWVRDIQRHGDKAQASAEALIGAYYNEIYVFAYRQTGHKEDAMDLTQDIFLAVLRALPRFARRKAGFRTWLYRIATNKSIDRRRRFQPVTVPLDSLELPAPEGALEQLQDRQLLAQVEAYVARQDPQLQAVFRLRLYGEKSFPEIAAILGLGESAVKSQYYRLLGRLRKEFSHE